MRGIANAVLFIVIQFATVTCQTTYSDSHITWEKREGSIYEKPTNDDVIEMDSYAIARIVHVPEAEIEYMGLRHNFIDEFPSLGNISPTLVTLDLEDNRLSVIEADKLEEIHLVKNLFLQDNRLISFPTTSQPMSIVKLILNRNLLDKIPQFGTVGESLEILQMSECAIVSMRTSDFLQFGNLQELDIEHNLFTSVPPLNPVSHSLRQLSLKSAPISYISYELMKSLPNIKRLDLDAVDFEICPNFCHLTSSTLEELSLEGNLVVDCHLVWLSLVSGGHPPPGLTNPKTGLSIAAADLNAKCDGMRRTFKMNMLVDMDGPCGPPPIVAEESVSSILECVQLCLSRAGCQMIRLRIDADTEDMICGVSASITSTSKFVDDGNGGQWFMLD